MATSQRLAVILSLCAGALSLKLPHYIKPCSRNDPEFNACAKRHAIEAIPQFVNGDPKYKVPVLDPLRIEELLVEQGSGNFGMTFVARNVSPYGLKDVTVKDIRIDLQKQHIEYDLAFPQLSINCTYNVTGKVLVLPITGNGDGNIVVYNVTANLRYDYDRTVKGDKDYVLPKNSRLQFDAQGLKIHLVNLFNGDKFLGEDMNRFLNENWREFLEQFGPAIGEAMNQVVINLLTNIFLLVPYDDAFPEKIK